MNKPIQSGRLAWAVVAAWVVAGAAARADSWFSPVEVKETTNVFGKTTVVLRYDGVKRRNFPEYTLKVYQEAQLLDEHQGVGFSEVFADSENRYFLGVSNLGLVGTAWVVFDHNGKILNQQKHGDIQTPLKYCRMTITIMRQWYDEKQPEPQFKVEDGKLKEVSVRNCEGKRIVLPLEKKTK
jgi:hypothetical protein